MAILRIAFPMVAAVLSSAGPVCPAEVDDAAIRKAATLYASFDERVAGDFGKGGLSVSTRQDHPKKKGRYVFETGFPREVFRIAKGRGIHGGALEAADVLPRRGRVFFPAKDNIAYRRDGWGGTVSFWLNTHPDKLLKTRFCDPVQITQRGASNGGLWIDFPDTKPRDLRLGAFRALQPGEKPIPQSDPKAPLILVKKVGFKQGEWHHLAMTWRNFDTGRANAEATLYIDGIPVGQLKDRDVAMQWEIDKTGIYIAVNYVGLLDEFAVFHRPLSAAEVARLRDKPDVLAGLKDK